MFALLSPRLWIFAAIVAALAFSHFTVYRKGRADVQAQWTLAVAQANLEVAKINQRRQSLADEAAQLAAKRTRALAADARAARASADGLRDAIESTERLASQSLAASNNAVRTLGELLNQCSAAYLDVARDADAAVSEVKTLRDAWPK